MLAGERAPAGPLCDSVTLTKTDCSEAMLLNRTLVVKDHFCLSYVHIAGLKADDWRTSTYADYYDMDDLIARGLRIIYAKSFGKLQVSGGSGGGAQR